jgi:hypothetical protein
MNGSQCYQATSKTSNKLLMQSAGQVVIDAGAGQACVSSGYRVEDLTVRGAGAKTLAYAEPSQLAIVMHVWRPEARRPRNGSLGCCGTRGCRCRAG